LARRDQPARPAPGDAVISDEALICTDAVTGAESRLTRFQVRTARPLTSADDALVGLDPDGVIFAINSKSGRAIRPGASPRPRPTLR
jgi:hypothetical protein